MDLVWRFASGPRGVKPKNKTPQTHPSRGTYIVIEQTAGEGCSTYAAIFFCLTFVHRARCAAAIFLRAAADIVRVGFTATPFVDALFAHRAFCARLIFLRAAAERVCLGFV